MTFVDTNYFLRLIRHDTPHQTKMAKSLFQSGLEGSKTLFTSDLVIFEINWVLTSFYKSSKTEVIEVLNQLLALTFIKYENRPLLIQTLHLFQHTSLSLEDCHHLIYAKSKKAQDFATFDQKLKKTFNQLLEN
jgi:predicted nucleic acid-binding protein